MALQFYDNAYLRKVGQHRQNMAESIENTTFSTTKAHGWNWDKVKGVGRNP